MRQNKLLSKHHLVQIHLAATVSAAEAIDLHPIRHRCRAVQPYPAHREGLPPNRPFPKIDPKIFWLGTPKDTKQIGDQI